MKRARLQMTAAAVLAMMLLGGCGEQPYELSEGDTKIITDYSAHVVAKYNTFQEEGIAYVEQELVPEEDTEDYEQERNQEEETDTEEGSDKTAGSEDSGTGMQQASFDELFGAEGITITYAGTRLVSDNVQDTFYALDKKPGNIYLVVDVEITNTGSSAVTMDNLSRMPKFKVIVNGDVAAHAEMTVLTEDFSTYQETIAAGALNEAVLLFQVPESVTEVSSLVLEVTLDGTGYQIIL